MKSYVPISNTFAAVLMLLTMVIVQGCNSSRTGSANETELKKGFENKGFNINDVPPGQREQVRALMNGGKGGPSRSATPPPAK